MRERYLPCAQSRRRPHSQHYACLRRPSSRAHQRLAHARSGPPPAVDHANHGGRGELLGRLRERSPGRSDRETLEHIARIQLGFEMIRRVQERNAAFGVDDEEVIAEAVRAVRESHGALLGLTWAPAPRDSVEIAPRHSARSLSVTRTQLIDI